jgi:hypothetical protein
MADRAGIDRVSPFWLGTGISALLILLLITSETVFDRWELLFVDDDFDPLARVQTGVLRDLRIAVVHCLLVGYLPAALLHVLQHGKRTVGRLQGALNCTRQECDRLAQSIRLSRRGLLVAALIGIAMAFLPPHFVEPVPDAPWHPRNWNPEVAWHRILGPLMGAGLAWLIYAIVVVSLRMSRIAQRLSRIDLLDLSSLSPFAQQGLNNALLLIGVLSISALMMLETGFMMLIIIIGTGTLVLAGLALLAPVRGVQKRVREARQRELDWTAAEISRLRDGFTNADPDRRSGDLADIVAYRTVIAGVSEWPFSGSTYVRLIIYAFIPLASWGLGVVAEEVIGRVFF